MSVMWKRVCDTCEADYEASLVSWMTLTFPNYIPGDNDPQSMEFDFCTYGCLQTWVNEEDEDDSLSQMTDNHTPPGPQVSDPIAEKPPMTLAEALSSGALQLHPPKE
jgi:hypothetical protein